MPMSMVGVGVRLLLGVVLGHLLPRLPMLILCRTKGFNLGSRLTPLLRLDPGPDGPRVSRRARVWWGVLPLTLLPLLFGRQA
ncbi:MAG: hypothetical protein CM15mP79_1600 [Methanobacteriota archaeon]|nr:MAG: hypothetical protein CM15mP79_1600 [Euryarchaeota archaeon]